MRAAWPPTLFDALAGVNLILHTGDVGELWMLDQLSQIAPVVAVHGNATRPRPRLSCPISKMMR